MQNDVKIQFAVFLALVITASVLFGFCISEGISTAYGYIYLISGVFSDALAYFVLKDIYGKYRNDGHADDIPAV